MALVKRGKTWHTHFFVDGQRFRQSLGTTKYREAQKEESKLKAQAEQGSLNASSDGFAKLAFTKAVESYFNLRRLELSEVSQKKERQLLVKPSQFFQQKCLAKITAEDILQFREWRSKSGVGASIMNMEVGVIRRMLKRAKRWHMLAADIRPLKEPRSIGRALTYEEKLRLMRAAGQNEEWQRAQAAMSLALCTTMRGCEIKRLQWRNIDFLNRAILVRTRKTDAGQRLIPMNEETLEIVVRLRDRAKGFGGTEPQH
jgi:integrase